MHLPDRTWRGWVSLLVLGTAAMVSGPAYAQRGGGAGGGGGGGGGGGHSHSGGGGGGNWSGGGGGGNWSGGGGSWSGVGSGNRGGSWSGGGLPRAGTPIGGGHYYGDGHSHGHYVGDGHNHRGNWGGGWNYGSGGYWNNGGYGYAPYYTNSWSAWTYPTYSWNSAYFQDFVGPFGVFGLEGLTYLNTAASYLYWQTNDATWDLYHNYVAAPGYRSTYREMYKLLQLVKVISAAIRDEEVGAVGPAFLPQLQADLREAHRLLEGVRLDAQQWTSVTAASAAAPPLPVKLERLSATLAEIMEAAGLPVMPSSTLAAPSASAAGPVATLPATTSPTPTPTPLPEPRASGAVPGLTP